MMTRELSHQEYLASKAFQDYVKQPVSKRQFATITLFAENGTKIGSASGPNCTRIPIHYPPKTFPNNNMTIPFAFEFYSPSLEVEYRGKTNKSIPVSPGDVYHLQSYDMTLTVDDGGGDNKILQSITAFFAGLLIGALLL